MANEIMTNQKRFLRRFFYKLTNNGSLFGDFSNNVSADIVSESADRIKGCEDKECNNCRYHGTYISTWRHDNKPENEAVIAELKIFRKTGKLGSDKLFSLEWHKLHKNNELFFKGEGMLCDDILIGNYYEPDGDEIKTNPQANP